MNQTEMILDYIQKNGSITPLEALQELGCFRLGARVWEIRSSGIPVEMEMVEENGKRYAKYYIKKSRPADGTAERQGEDGGLRPHYITAGGAGQ